MTRFLRYSPLLLLMACVPVEETPVVDTPKDECSASQYQGLVGQPAAALTSMNFPIGTRIIQPGSAVTMDYRPDRLNIEISTNQRIEKISCY